MIRYLKDLDKKTIEELLYLRTKKQEKLESYLRMWDGKIGNESKSGKVTQSVRNEVAVNVEQLGNDVFSIECELRRKGFDIDKLIATEEKNRQIAAAVLTGQVGTVIETNPSALKPKGAVIE